METKQGKKESPRTGGWISALKFLPLVVFAALVIVFKLELLLAAPIATFVAILVYIFIYRGNFDGAFEQGLKSARSIIGVFFILMERDALQGDGQGLNLSYDFLRTMVALDRLGALDRKE